MHALSKQRRGVGLALPGDVGRGAVDALENRSTLADIAARREAQPADQARAKIAHDVPVKIGQHHHVKALRIGDKLHTAVVHDDFIGTEPADTSLTPRGSSLEKARRSSS